MSKRVMGDMMSVPEVGSQRKFTWHSVIDHRIAVLGSEAFAAVLSQVADVVVLDPMNADSPIGKISAIVVIPSEELGWGELFGAGERMQTIRALAKAQCARLDLYDFHDVMKGAELAEATSLFDAVVTNSPVKYNSSAASIERTGRLHLFPYPISADHFSPVDLEGVRRRELVYCKDLDREIPVSARRALSGASTSNIATHLYAVNPSSAVAEGSTGIDLGGNVIHRVEVIPDSETYQELSRFSEFAACDELTPANDSGGVGILGHLACGTIVFADYSRFVNGEMPSVAMVEAGEDLQSYIGNLPSEYYALARIDGIRHVFTSCTIWNWIEHYEEIAFGSKSAEPVVAVISKRYSDFEQFTSSQTVSGRFVYAANDEDASAAIGPGAGFKIYLDRIPFRTPNLYADLKAASRYSTATYFEICAADDPRRAYTETDELGEIHVHAVWVSGEKRASSSILVRTDVLLEADSLNKPSFGILSEKDLTIVIPVFNNGKHLLYKGLQSLWRESIQDVAEVQVVDDGSTDAETLHILDLLESSSHFPGIIRLPRGGSGSAARPRNVALEQVQTQYVTFLDPDDEQMGRGYRHLLDGIVDSQSEIAIGNTVVRRGGRIWVGNVPNVETGLKQLGVGHDARGRYDLGGDNADLLVATAFQPFSIQATIAEVDFLNRSDLRQAEGAFGEDSLFSLQMLYAARSVSFVRSSIFVYNAEVPGSAVNSISLRFFEKSLVAEKAQVNWLKSLGLMDAYASRRFMKMLNVWYLQKVKELEPERKPEGLAIINSIAELYGEAVTHSLEYQNAMRSAGLEV